MRRFLARSVLSAFVLTLTSVMAYAQGAGAAGSTTTQTTSSTTQFDFWWYSDSALATFLTTSHPGVTIITPGSSIDSLAPTIKAKGYGFMGGLGGYAAEWAQGYPSASDVAAIESQIDKIAAEGATMIFVNEPYGAPGQSTATSATSIAYNVKGFNILYNYIHSKHPGIQFGLVIGDDGGDALHLSMLKAGLHEDFSAVEDYNACCHTALPFPGQKAAFPNVKTMILAYNTETLCNANPTKTGYLYSANSVDIWGFWDLDNYGGWIGPDMDGSWLQNAETFAATGSQTSFCALPVSFIIPAYWTNAVQTKTFTVPIGDITWYYSGTSPYTTTKCEYMVMSGSGGINGPNDPSMKVTVPWTARTCETPSGQTYSITITVGSSGNCNVIGTDTCLVFTRAHTTTGLVGNVTYQQYSIDY